MLTFSCHTRMVFSFVISPPSFKSLFSFYWRLFLSILSSQTDPPILKNVDFIMRILTFCRNQRFRSKNGFAIVFGLSRAPFGSSWGALGSPEGLLSRPKRASRFILKFSWAWFARLLLPEMALGGWWGCRCRFLSPLGASWGRFWTPKLTLPPSKMLILLKEY